MITPHHVKKVKVPLPKLSIRTADWRVSLWQLLACLVGFAGIGGYILYRSLPSTTRAPATVTVSGPKGSSYPSTFYTGPAGHNILLPPNNGYPSKGAWIGEESDAWPTNMLGREHYIGRKFNIYSYYSQGRCDDYPTIAAQVVAHGWIPVISWFPTPSNADQVIFGAADRCIQQFASSVASGTTRVFVRPYWEFNAGSYPFSMDSDGTRATATQEMQMWRHTVDVIRRNASAASKITLVWCPDEGYYNNGDAWNSPTPYPGDNYVDWVCSDGYNWGSSTAWCGLHAGWCNFSEVFTHGNYAPTYTPNGVEYDFRGRKPYMVGETGSIEDPSMPGRKGQWMTGMEAYIKSYMPGLYAVVYLDSNYGNVGMQLDTSTSSLDGYKAFANDPYFNVSPITKITKAAIDRKHRTAKLTFKATGHATGFQCALMEPVKNTKHHKNTPKPHFSACRSPTAYKHLRRGKYILEVRALSPAGAGPVTKRRFDI